MNKEEFEKLLAKMEASALEAKTLRDEEAAKNEEKNVQRFNELNERFETMQKSYNEVEAAFMEMQKKGVETNSTPTPELTHGEAFVSSKSYEDALVSDGQGVAAVDLGSLGGGEVEMVIATGVEGHKSSENEEKNYSKLMKKNRSWSNNIVGRKLKTLTTLASSVGNLIVPIRLPEVVDADDQPQALRDFLNVTTTDSPQLEWIVTHGDAIVANVVGATAAAQTNIVVDNITGFEMADIEITITDGTNSEVGIVASYVRDTAGDGGTVTLTAPLANAYIAGSTYLAAEYFSATNEGRLKPQSDLKVDVKNVSFVVFAVGIRVTRQMWMAAKVIKSMIDRHLMKKAKRNEAYQILYGTGASGQVQGLMNTPQPNLYTQDAAETKYDALLRATTALVLRGLTPSKIIVSTLDGYDMKLEKDNNGAYMNVFIGGRAWDIPVFESNQMKTKSFLIVSDEAFEVWEYEGMNIRVAEQHSDLFMRNVLQVLLEHQMQIALYDEKGIVVGTFL